MMAFNNMEKVNYSLAVTNIEKARQWPENLGVGKPYDSDIDERFEKFLQALCLEKMKKKPEADKIYSALTTEKINFQNANLLINALAFKKTGREENGTRLLEEWKVKSTDTAIPDWCIKAFRQNTQRENLPSDTDQLRLLSRLFSYLSAQK